MEIKGRLREDHLPDLLQVLVSLGKTGRLIVEEGRGPLAAVSFQAGRVHAARCLHLAGEEALLACLFWNQGSYYFQDDLGGLPAEEAGNLLPIPFHLSHFLIRALSLADELERRRALVPQEGMPLFPGAAAVPEDPFACGLEQVAGALARWPGASRAELEQTLSLAPVKVRLALALLAEAGAVEVRPSGRRAGTGAAAAPPWWSSLGDGGTLRILITGDERVFSAASFYALAESLAGQLGVSEPWTSFLPHGPSFIRLRPAGRGLLSLSLLPSNGRDGTQDCLAFAAAHDVVVTVGPLPPECEQRLAGLQHQLLRLDSLAQLHQHLSSLVPAAADGGGGR